MKCCSVLLGVLLLGVSTNAATNGDSAAKPPWRWTLGERLAVRSDPVAAAERLREAHSAQIASGKKIAVNAAQTPSDQLDFISGREHPELLLPWEIFDHTMAMAYADDVTARTVFREVRDSYLLSSGLPTDFWSRLEILSRPYLSDSTQLHDLHRGAVTDAAVRRRIARETAVLEV